MNLRPEALKLFVRALIEEGLSIHVDHRAVLALLDNLTERAASADATENKIIRQLQIDLLTTAIQFHNNKSHRHVTPRLEALLKVCQSLSTNLVLIEEDAHEADYELDEGHLLNHEVQSQDEQNQSPEQEPPPSDDEDLDEDLLAWKHNPHNRIDKNSRDETAANQPQSPAQNPHDAMGRIATLPDGNCLYNTIAVGLKRYPWGLGRFWDMWAKLQRQDMPFNWPANVKQDSIQDACLTSLLTMLAERNEQMRTDFIGTLVGLSDDDVQLVFAPLLRYLACTYALAKRDRLSTNIYMPDGDNLKAILTPEALWQTDVPGDYMGLLDIPFVWGKVREIVYAPTSLEDNDAILGERIAAFRTWWNAEGDANYIRYLSHSAGPGSNRHLWGSEIELGALCDCLGITTVYQREHWKMFVGRQAGMFSVRDLQSAGCQGNDLNFLEQLGSAEKACYFDMAKNAWVTDGLRFNEKATSVLNALSEAVTYKGPPVRRPLTLTSETAKENHGIVSYIHNQAQRIRITPLAFMQKNVADYPPSFSEALQTRGILTSGGCFISDDGQPDYARINERLRILSPATKATLGKRLNACIPLFTATTDGSHWTCLLDAKVVRRLNTPDTSLTRPNVVSFRPASAARLAAASSSSSSSSVHDVGATSSSSDSVKNPQRFFRGDARNAPARPGPSTQQSVIRGR